MKQLWKRLKNRKGESLVETLVALLVIALGFAMLPGAIVASARVNARVEEQNIFPKGDHSFAKADANSNITKTEGVTLTITPKVGSFSLTDSTALVTVLHETKASDANDEGYYYFAYKETSLASGENGSGGSGSGGSNGGSSDNNGSGSGGSDNSGGSDGGGAGTTDGD